MAGAAEPVAGEPRLFVGQVPIEKSEEDLGPLFSPYGTVKALHLVKGTDGKHKGCAMVLYERWGQAEAAMEAHDGRTVLDGGKGRPLVVHFANPRRQGPGQQPEPGIAPKKLFVGQVPKEVDEDALRPYFESYGEIVRLNILRTQRGLGPSAGCAFVEFKKWAQAEAAMEAHNGRTKLGDSDVPLVVKFADARKREDRPVSGQKRQGLNEADGWQVDKRQSNGIDIYPNNILGQQRGVNNLYSGLNGLNGMQQPQSGYSNSYSAGIGLTNGLLDQSGLGLGSNGLNNRGLDSMNVLSSSLGAIGSGNALSTMGMYNTPLQNNPLGAVGDGLSTLGTGNGSLSGIGGVSNGLGSSGYGNGTNSYASGGLGNLLMGLGTTNQDGLGNTLGGISSSYGTIPTRGQDGGMGYGGGGGGYQQSNQVLQSSNGKMGRGLQDDQANQWKLFVGQVPLEANEQDLWQLFSPVGEVLELYILRNNATGKSRGCAFVTYSSKYLAHQAITQLNGKQVAHGKALVVKFADRATAGNR